MYFHSVCGLYTARHLFQCVAEHKNSATGEHFLEGHGSYHLLNETLFNVLRTSQSKFDSLSLEMLYIDFEYSDRCNVSFETFCLTSSILFVSTS